ncbi:MAG: hypothetical protein ABGY96_13160 [bacterium]
MANQDAAFGFRPVRHLTGGEIRNNTYRITTNYDTALYQGQMVTRVTAGTIETVAAAAMFLGIFNGCQYTDPTTGKPTWAKYYPADVNTSDIEAYVFDDPYIVFEGQHDGTGTEAMNFGGFDLAGVSGSTKTGRSTQEIGTSTLATTGTWKQIGISKDPSNSDTSADNTNAYVVPSQDLHFFLQAATLA